MNRKCSNNASVRSVLAAPVVGVLGLAASPAALAIDRGGPGKPGAQPTATSGFSLELSKQRPGRFLSWSD
jgi:hypothetical protein